MEFPMKSAPLPGKTRTPSLHSGPILDTVEGYDVIACQTCGFSHIDPLPTDEDLRDLYTKDYYSDEKPNYLAEAHEDEEWSRLEDHDKLKIMADNLPKDRRRLLDVGSGPGFFVKAALEAGWSAQGVEPSPHAAGFAKQMGLNITEGFFDKESAASLGKFDALNFRNMLEHVPNPIELVRLASQVLDDDGIICVSVPNDYNPMQQILSKGLDYPPWWVFPKHHLNYFTFETISGLLESNGLQEIVRTTSFPMELFALMGDNYVGNEVLGRACHKKRCAFDLSFEKANMPETRQTFYQKLAEAGMGRTATIIARKSA
jgi:SAM-dependent methyltransferase